IREIFIKDDVIEAIISLPQGLFYGTGIPACVLVCNKNKTDHLRNKVLFINADREFAEGKNQNKLRPEDIEKIDYVFTNKLEIPKYSRLVDTSEIVDKHDYNLNIRRYVDNTPATEPEDVQAHLIGGIPEDEVRIGGLANLGKRFGIKEKSIFEQDRPGYLKFIADVKDKENIRKIIEADKAVKKILVKHTETLENWWKIAQNDFALLERVNNGNGNGKKMPDVRLELLTTLKAKLVPLKILDEFKSAGVFVNWWQQIRYDLKTIVSTGWHHTLIPDEYLIAEFFQAEADEIESLETRISELQSELAEAVETAQETVAYEPDEDEKVTATVIKKALKALIDDLKDTAGASAKQELDELKKLDAAIKKIEKKIKDAKASLKEKTTELELKLELKRLGAEVFTDENRELIRQVDKQLAELDEDNKTDKKKITALQKDKAALKTRIARTDALLAEIDGQLTVEEAKRLILKKLYDIASRELERYLSAEKRAMIQSVENLWNKYAISGKKLEQKREEMIEELNGFLEGLGYLP
ncbi:MAG TPA: N-6 DNA methylase, partial [Marinilabiliaceae bacterium]|nr:N-6 DNA methylase [Marinilabiliaceae bacterium]